MTLLMPIQNILTFCDMEVPAKHFGFMYFLFLLTNTFGIICDYSKNECHSLNVMLFSECNVI